MIKILLRPVRLGESAAAKHRRGFDTTQPAVHFRAGVVELADEGENNATPPIRSSTFVSAGSRAKGTQLGNMSPKKKRGSAHTTVTCFADSL